MVMLLYSSIWGYIAPLFLDEIECISLTGGMPGKIRSSGFAPLRCLRGHHFFGRWHITPSKPMRTLLGG